MKTSNLIIGAVLLGGVSYLAIKKGLFKKKSVVTNADIKEVQETEDIKNQLLADVNKAKLSSESLQNPMSDKSKIARIQLALGIASDGIFGNQTLNAVRNKIAELIKLYGGSQLANSLYSLSLSEWQNSTNINTLYQIFTKVGLITA
jgi:hypothetical protein